MVEEPQDAAIGPELEFVGEDHGEELGVGEVSAFGLAEAGFQVLAHAGELQDSELMDDLIVHEKEASFRMK